MVSDGTRAKPLRARVNAVVNSASSLDWRGLWFDRALIALILANVLAVILETEQGIEARYGTLLDIFEVFSVTVFSIEYVVRLWVCVENVGDGSEHPLIERVRYAVSVPALIDLAAVLPFYLGLVLVVDLRFLRVLRLVRLLKLTRYSPALETVGAVMYGQRRSLVAAAVILGTMLVFSSSIVYLIERVGQPDAFGSIPAAMWWALATLTTVGYGDVTPHSPAGKLAGGLVMIVGILMFALPTGILANGFAAEIKKREFVVTWKLVAKVPLFSRLDALAISEIAGLLHPKLVPPRYSIVRRGEEADAMYFLLSGEAEVDAPGGVFQLGQGDYFGEIALLQKSVRTATVTTLTDCHLLVLPATSFERLLRDHPELRDALDAVMAERLTALDSEAGHGGAGGIAGANDI